MASPPSIMPPRASNRVLLRTDVLAQRVLSRIIDAGVLLYCSCAREARVRGSKPRGICSPLFMKKKTIPADIHTVGYQVVHLFNLASTRD